MKGRGGSIWIPALLGALACSADDPTGVVPDAPTPDPAAGEIAFRASCAGCHASGDGFDLAYFGFADFDIVRRAVDHVDTATARNIVAYVHTLGVAPAGAGAAAPFQPAGGAAATDASFWQATFGVGGWPEDLTADALRSLSLRDVAVPLRFAPWSSESDESDWMPEHPLPETLLSAEGGALRAALDAYGASSSEATLLTAIDVFQTLTRTEDETSDKLCAGGANAHVHPAECFEARRWMSSLAAVHYLRSGATGAVPFEVADLWWDTGETAVTMFFRSRALSQTAVASWLYLATTFAPDGFPGPFYDLAEDSGYMGQFLQGSGLERMALLASLRRMVDRGPIHEEHPSQSYWDLYLAVTRSPRELRGDALMFGLGYLEAETSAGRIPTGEQGEFATELLDGLLTSPVWDPSPLAPEARAEAEARIAELKTRIAGA